MMRTPNYYVQQMYGMNKGTEVLLLTQNGKAVEGQDSLYATAALDAPTGEVIVKLVNNHSTPTNVQLQFKGLKKQKLHSGSCTYLQSDNLEAVNTLSQETVVPRIRPVTINGDNSLALELAPYSFEVYRLQFSK